MTNWAHLDVLVAVALALMSFIGYFLKKWKESVDRGVELSHELAQFMFGMNKKDQGHAQHTEDEIETLSDKFKEVTDKIEDSNEQRTEDMREWFKRNTEQHEEVRAELEPIKEDLSNVKGNVEGIKDELQDVKRDVERNKIRLDKIEN